MKKILLTLLGLIVAAAALAGAGFVGYRMGFNHSTVLGNQVPPASRFEHMNPGIMPHNGEGFNRGPGREFGFEHYSMMRPGGFHGRGFGFFSPFHFLWNAAILGLIIWFVYWLVTKSGWQITRKTVPVVSADSTNEEGK